MVNHVDLDPWTAPFGPYRIRKVERIPITRPEERLRALEGGNPVLRNRQPDIPAHGGITEARARAPGDPEPRLHRQPPGLGSVLGPRTLDHLGP